MSQPSVRHPSVTASQQGVDKRPFSRIRSTGSPLLDSLVLAQQVESTVYLAQPVAASSGRQHSLRRRAELTLHALPTAERGAASTQSRQSVPAKPAQASSSPAKQTATSSGQPSDPPPNKPSVKPPTSQNEGNCNTADRSAISVAAKSQNNPAPQLEKQASSTPAKAKAVAALQSAPARLVSKDKNAPRPPIAPVVQRSKRLPNPSLERAAAVGMLDLSDKLLFGGEDDALMSTYLSDRDPLTAGGDETIVLKYLSQQITESKLTKIKGRLPLAVRAEPKTEPSQAVLDARNFKVVQAALKSKDAQVTVERKQAETSMDVAAMGKQIAHLNRQVELLTKQLSNIALKDSRSESGEAA